MYKSITAHTAIALLFILVFIAEPSAQRMPVDEFSFSGEDIYLYEFSPSGQKLAAALFNRIVVVDTQTKQVISTFTGHEEFQYAVYSIAFSPDEQLAASGSRATAKVWRVDNGEEVKSFNTASYGTPISKYVTAVTFFPDGEKLISLEPSSIQIWDMNSEEELRRIFTPYHSTELNFLPDGIHLLEVSRYNARILSVATGVIIREHSGGLATLSNDGAKIFLGSNVTGSGNTLVVQQWDIAKEILLSSSVEFESQITPADISRDGKRVLIANEETKNTIVVNLETSGVTTELESDGIKFFQQPRFSEDDNNVYGISGRSLKVWDISDLTSHVPIAEMYK